MNQFNKEFFVLRFWQDDKQTQGSLIIKDNTKDGQIIFNKPCLERGDMNNQKMISCIPEGTYPIELEYSPRFDMELWELKQVPNRSECKIHAVNFARDLNGCIAPGDDITDMDNDGYFDITNSRNTMKQFHKAMSGINRTVIHIVDLTLMTK